MSPLYQACHQKNNHNNEADQNRLHSKRPHCTVHAYSRGHANQERDQSDEYNLRRRYHGDSSLTQLCRHISSHGNRKAAARLDYDMRMLRWMEHYLQAPGGDPPANQIDYGLEEDEPTSGLRGCLGDSWDPTGRGGRGAAWRG